MVVSGCAGKKQNNIKPEVVNNQVQEQPNSVATSTSFENNATSSKTVDTSDWQNYQNKSYGFEISMPKEYFEFSYGVEPLTPEEVGDISSSSISLFGINMQNYIEFHNYDRQKIEKSYLINKTIDSLSFKKNENGVNYFYMSDSHPKIKGEIGIFCMGEKTDEHFICLYIRTEEKNYQQFFDKVISSYKKI